MEFDFAPLVKGEPDWHTKLNDIFAGIRSALANKANKGRELTWVEAPLSEGITGYFTYGRDQLGKVEIFCLFKLSAPLAHESVQITTLPEGFRPLTASRAYDCELSHDGSSGISVGRFHISTESGSVILLNCVDNSRTDLDTVRATFSYTAR